MRSMCTWTTMCLLLTSPQHILCLKEQAYGQTNVVHCCIDMLLGYRSCRLCCNMFTHKSG